MKRYVIALALTSIAACGFAAMNNSSTTAPNLGLPQGWTITNTMGYGTAAGIDGNPASTMCVECHSINPSSRALQVSNSTATVPTASTAAASCGTHFVMNAQAGGGSPLGTTNSGGGYDSDFTGAPRDNGQYFRGGAWTTSGTTSKFAVAGTAPEVFATVRELGAGFATNTADMICESCHNILANTTNTVDNDLLVGVYRDNVTDTLCTGCHAQNEAAGNARLLAFHTNDNLKPFSATATAQPKRHHVMSGDILQSTTSTVGTYTDDLANNYMWAPSASDIVTNTWCNTPYAVVAPGSQTRLAIAGAGEPIAFRNACNVAGSGTRVSTAPATLGDIIAQGATSVSCTNCHRPHNARANAGAYIFRQGVGGSSPIDGGKYTPADFTPQVGTGTFSGVTNANIAFGLRRQHDVDSSYALKVYTDYRPLCAGCHYGY